MYGARSSHWPSNADAPPTPSGPTTSGGLPDANFTENACRAPSYAVWSKTTWMFACDALKALMSFAKVFCWLSSSPPPRQQNQVIFTGPPGGTVAGPVGLGAAEDATALGEAATPLGDGVAFPPQAVT